MLSIQRSARNIAKACLQVVTPIHFRLRTEGRPVILLTFDDGPHPTVTPAVLKRLEKYQAKALFFIVGDRIPLAPHMLAEILAHGHWIGNHTFTHPFDEWPKTGELVEDVGRCQHTLISRTQIRPRFFRPPMGLSIAAVVAARTHRLITVHWSVDSCDWRFASAEEARQHAADLAAQIRPGDILLCHDDKPLTLEVLDILLPRLVARGIDFSSGLDYLPRSQ